MKKFFITLLVLLWTFAVLASTADDISRNVNHLIRSAEKEYFKGKTIEVSGILQEAEAELIKLKSEDPGHRSLKSLQTKYDRLKKRVDKKMGNSASTAKNKSGAASDDDKPSSASKLLSYGAKSNLKKAAREMDFAEKELAKGEKSLKDKQFNLINLVKSR